jgi:predicted acylesterase/phospholipase RssA
LRTAFTPAASVEFNRTVMTTPPRLRLALVIPGAVSLGAYEAGVLAALLGLIRESGGAIVVDTIVGASAGAITGTILAHSLLTGADARHLEELWLEQTSIENLLRGRRARGRAPAPLHASVLERWASEAIGAGAEDGGQAEPIVLVTSITNLRGVRYRIARLEDERAHVDADTYRDARAFVLSAGTDAEGWRSAIGAAIASAANGMAFGPVKLRRRRSEYPRSVQWDGEAEQEFWYTDGGTVFNVPLGFALDAVFDPDAVLERDAAAALGRERTGDTRLFVLVHPHPTSPPKQWPPDGGTPSFFGASVRAFNASRAQSIYDDLRRMEKTNTRIATRVDLQSALLTALPREGGDGQAGDGLRAALAAAAERAMARKAGVRSAISGRDVADEHASLEARVAARSPGAMNVFDLVDFLLDEATGTGGKQSARLDVVSPEIDAPGVDATTLLAGEPLGHFFGFALRRARESDFGLGHRNMQTWWRGYASEDGTDPALAKLAVPDHPLARRPAEGGLSTRDVPTGRRLVLGVRLAGRYARELARTIVR